MATNLERKIELIQWLSVIDDAVLLEKIADLRNGSVRDWWDQIPEKEKNSIDRGIADADAGKLKPHSEARVIYEKRL